ncbi:MAG: preprotein translocase subunit SecA, partial [Rhodothermales bacterium]
MIKFVQKLFGGDSNDRDLKKLWPFVEEINAHLEAIQRLSEAELQGKTAEFKGRIKEAVSDIEKRQEEIREEMRRGVSETPTGGDGQTAEAAALSLDEWQSLSDEYDELDEEWLEVVDDELDALLPEAFAVVKVACERMKGKTWEAGGTTVTWDMVQYDVQLLGGVAIHQGRVAEMKTGEGKTLVAIAPVYLNALVGRGVHLVTVNPYLAQRDAEWMGPLYEYLGLTVDVIDKYEAHSEGRRAAYRADITYGTNNEFGFDYLRDHSFVTEPDQLVQ